MAGLGETVSGIVRARRSAESRSKRLGDGGMSEVRGFGFNPGALRMLAYVPAGLAPGAPLVVVLHGCTQRAAPYASAAGWLTLADRLGFVVLAPEQGPANNPNRCFNWFNPDDAERGSGEAASIHAMVQHAIRLHDCDPDRVFVTGLSAGGAMTAVMLAAYPETFAAGAVVAGLPYGLARNAQEAFAAMHGVTRLDARELGDRVGRAAPAPHRQPRLAVWHGLSDATVASGNGQALARQWAAVHGLSERPDDVVARAGWTRSVWRGPDGQSLIESNTLSGLGHGTPLAAGGDDPIGQVAPFMLEAGVSSSLEIARFWGLAPAGDRDHVGWTASAAPPEDTVGRANSLGESVMAAVSPHVSDDIRKVIAAALGSAGLIR